VGYGTSYDNEMHVLKVPLPSTVTFRYLERVRREFFMNGMFNGATGPTMSVHKSGAIPHYIE
jgi:hypothetical protein